MSKKLYPNQDINDIIASEEEEFFKGGVGSGKRGHTTNRPESSSYQPQNGMKGAENRKYTYAKANLKGKMVSQDEFETASVKALMSYSGFDGNAGSYMSRKQMIQAIAKETGTPAQQAGETLENLERMGRVKQIGKVFIVMQETKSSSNPDKDARIRENDKIIADHPVKTSKNSPTGG